MIHQLCFVTNL